MKRGFSLVEALITLFIVSVLASAVYYTYTTLFRGTKASTESVELQIEKSIGLELLRLDLEHLGYGVARDATDKILDWDSDSKTLTIRSTINNTNESTIGWVLCVNGIMSIDARKDTSNGNLVFIDTSTENYSSAVTNGTCPASGVFLGFPFQTGANACDVGGTDTCTTIVYSLSSTNLPDHCHPDTKNLLRAVNDGNGNPVLSCVADFRVRFDLDTNGDGKIDCSTDSCLTDVVPATNDLIRTQLKNIHVYVLVQEGGLNKEYTYTGGNPVVDGITLQLPSSNYEHYRWKAYKISIKPMGMFGGINVK